MRLILIFVLLFDFSERELAAQIQTLEDSEPLMRILEEVYAASYDFPNIYLIEVRPGDSYSQIHKSECVRVKAQMVKDRFEKVFNAYQEFYPDSALPFERAELDLELILGKQAYLQCSESLENKWEFVRVDYYRKHKGGDWIRFEVSQRKK